MPVDIECDNCGRAHVVPDRRFEPGAGGTRCPECGARSYTVRRDELAWHRDA